MASLVAQLVKNLPLVQETWVQFLGQEDLEKEMATQSSILAWKIPWKEEPGGLHTVHGVARVGHDLETKPSAHIILKMKQYINVQKRVKKELVKLSLQGDHCRHLGNLFLDTAAGFIWRHACGLTCIRLHSSLCSGQWLILCVNLVGSQCAQYLIIHYSRCFYESVSGRD